MTEYKSKLNFFTAGKTKDTTLYHCLIRIYFNVVNNLISEEVFRTDYNKLLLKGNIIWSRVRSTPFFGKTTSHGELYLWRFGHCNLFMYALHRQQG